MKIQDLINHFEGNQELQDRILKNWKTDWPEKNGDTSKMELDDPGLKSVLRGSFIWSGTDEGHDYWYEICNSLPS